MRFLYFKPQLTWPRKAGHDVHCFGMLDALCKRGHEVHFVTETACTPEAIAGLTLASYASLDRTKLAPGSGVRLSRFQARFASFWGVTREAIATFGAMARTHEADVVVVDGLNVLPYLAGIDTAVRVWFAADEWVWHHLSMFRLTKSASWHELSAAFTKGVYERVYASLLDRVWVVSENDRRAMRLVTGVRALDVLPNGTDTDYYHPFDVPAVPHSAVFWGRLDFGPNIQALEWFCGKVWPLVRQQTPDASLTIYGFNPTDSVRVLAGHDGITLIPDAPDIREAVSRHEIAIMPFVSGGGVKSKLLEALSMRMAVLGTPRCCNGLATDDPPLVQALNPDQWVREMDRLWTSESTRRSLGAKARQWVLDHHTWDAAATVVLQGLTPPIRRRKG